MGYMNRVGVNTSQVGEKKEANIYISQSAIYGPQIRLNSHSCNGDKATNFVTCYFWGQGLLPTNKLIRV